MLSLVAAGSSVALAYTDIVSPYVATKSGTSPAPEPRPFAEEHFLFVVGICTFVAAVVTCFAAYMANNVYTTRQLKRQSLFENANTFGALRSFAAFQGERRCCSLSKSCPLSVPTSTTRSLWKERLLHNLAMKFDLEKTTRSSRWKS